MAPDERIVAVAGGSGFIGRAIVRRLARIPTLTVRLLTRNPEAARRRIETVDRVEFIAADVTDPATLRTALAGANAVVNAVQFDGYPVENPQRGLTFERIDYGGTVAMLAAGKTSSIARFIYISGAAADERSPLPGFSAKGRAERAIRESGVAYTIFRPSLVYGAEDRVVNMLAGALRFLPLMPVPGTGRQMLQPVWVDDLAACVALAIGGRGRDATFDVGGAEAMTFDDLVRLLMEITKRRRPIVHIPEPMLRLAGRVAEMIPGALFSRDAAGFLTADNVCDIGPLVAEFGIAPVPARAGLAYLARKG
ncbi:MAG: NAD(P)H-binding protein [Candidatus Binataceae bacterium]